MEHIELSLKSNKAGIVKLLDKMALKVKNMTPAMRAATVVMLEYIERNFDTEGQNSGDKWPDWSEDYAEYRKKHNRGNGKIMTLSFEVSRRNFLYAKLFK